MALGRSGSIAITDANVLTMDPARPRARAVVIHDGIVAYVGSDEGAKGADRGVDTRIDAKGRTLIPGFNDAHGHFIHEGLMADRLDLSSATSLEDAYGRIGAYAVAHPEAEVLIAERWDDADWPVQAFPTRAGLDDVDAERPIFCRRVDGHVAVANSALLGRYAERYHGDPSLIDQESGLLLEAPALTFGDLFPPRDADLAAAIDRFIGLAHRHGVTSGQDFANVQYWRAWQASRRRKDRDGQELGIRMDVATYREHLEAYVEAGLMTGTGDDWLAVGGVKLFLDGSFGARSAYLGAPYADDPGNHGVPTFTDEELQRLVRAAHDAGLQLRAHAIGDAAVEQGTSAFESVAEMCGVDQFRAMRHRFEHYELSTPGQRRRARMLGVVLSVQPNFVGSWATEDGLYGTRLGARHRETNPFRTYLAEGLAVAFGSDVMPFGPLTGIRGAVTGPYETMRLDFRQCVHAYTTGAAYAQHREHVKGMLRPGMLGDCVLLSKNMSLEGPNDPAGLDGLDVAVTVLDGHPVYEAS